MGRKILIIDDDPGMQDAFRMIFERAGYQVDVLSSGNPILSGDFNIPDLFILDKQLSGIDGLDVCRYIKSNAQTQHLPVIIVSATPHVATLSKAVSADDFLEKPFRNKELLALVEKHLVKAAQHCEVTPIPA
jgi:DNA-binding response OmpR family regulator